MERLGGQADVPLRDIRTGTVVFVGGPMILADGSQVDSRQPMKDGATAQAVQGALTASPEWWAAVSSIVLPTLDDAEGGFALIVGQRSIFRATPDGETRRSGLRSLLQGGVGSLFLVRSGMNDQLPPDYQPLVTLRSSQGANLGAVGIRLDSGRPRWRFFDGNEYYFRVAANCLGAYPFTGSCPVG